MPPIAAHFIRLLLLVADIGVNWRAFVGTNWGNLALSLAVAVFVGWVLSLFFDEWDDERFEEAERKREGKGNADEGQHGDK